MATVAEDTFVGLQEVADELGVHRASVNEMVLAGRLEAERCGARWWVRREVLEEFAAQYVRPPNAPSRRPPVTEPSSAGRIRELLAEFGSASAAELAPFLNLHEGNVRKHLRLLELTDVVRRLPGGQWGLTPDA